MGWWKSSECVVGDETLDIVEECLDAITLAYQNALSRKPTAEELVESLNLVIRVRSQALFAGGDEQTLELQLRKKRQPRKWAVEPGDVFTIDLPDKTVAYGRMTPQASFAEFIGVRTKGVLSLARLRGFGTVRLPFLVPISAIEERRWKVIGRWPYKTFQVQPFRIAQQIADGADVRNGFIDPTTHLRPAVGEELSVVPQMGIATEAKVAHVLLSELPLLES